MASVWEARARGGETDARYALKIFHPPASTNIRRSYAIEGWLLAAERQRDAAKRHRVAVEILAFGRCDEGAFVVMPGLERPLEPLVETLAPTGDRLRAAAEPLLAALIAWDEQYGGPHGQLKPSNIFLGAGPLATAAVQLSDPWFEPGVKPAGLRTRDANAVGAVLAQIVRRRAATGWPIEDGPEWRALGRAGAGWRDLCNYLLNPRPAEGELSLAEAQRRLRRIPRDARPMRHAALIGGATLALAAAGIFGYARFGDPAGMPRNLRLLAEATGNKRALRETIVPEWALLCRAWASWLGDVQRNAPRWIETAELWAAPEDPLRAALVEFRGAADGLRPQGLVPAAARESRLGVLADSPRDEVREQLLRGTVAEDVENAWKKLDALAQQLADWPRWLEMEQLHAQLQARNFPRAAVAWRLRVPPVAPPGELRPDLALVLKPLNDLSLDDAGSLALLNRWHALARIAADMAASGDRVQAAMPALALAQLSDRSSLGEFADALAAPLDELRQRRARFLDTAVVRERFLRESPLLAETGPVTSAHVARWTDELAAFSRVTPGEDPRVAADFDPRVNRLSTGGQELESAAPPGETGLGSPPLSRPEFDRELAQLRGTLQSLRARDIVRRDVPAIREETTALMQTFTALEQRLDATLALLRPDLWLNRIAAQTWALAASRERWAAWRQAALGAVDSAALERDRARFRQLREQEITLRTWLGGLEGPNGFGAIATPELAGVGDEISAALAQLEVARREQAAAAVANAQTWRDALPASPWADASAAMRAPIEAHRGWVNELPALARDLQRLGALLSEGFAWSEGVADVFGQLTRRAGANALSGRPAEWIGEARRLSQLASSDDRAALAAAAQSGGLSVQITSWRRLGAIADWPAGASELDVDGALVAGMRERIARDVRDAARRRSLTDEIARATRERWNRAARNAARSENELAAVFQRMDRYGIGERDLDPPVAYNLALWRLKQADANETDLARLRARRDGFVNTARALAEAAQQPAVAGFLEKLGALELTEDPNRPRPLSPERAGWREAAESGGERVVASWSDGGRSVRLEFQLVQPTDGTPPFFLAVQPVAFGEFLELVVGRPEARPVIEALPRWTRGETLDKPWNKPMSWRPRDDLTDLELNSSWFYLTDAQLKALWENSALHASAPALARAVGETPTARTPLQQIPPDAARIFVEQLIGARLPRPDEWRALAKMHGGGVASGANSAGGSGAGGSESLAAREANFRDRAFQELWVFLENYREAGQAVRWRPNEGVFLPLQDAPGGGGRRRMADDGRAFIEADDGRFWFAPVDEGPSTGGFTHLFGNVWIYLYDDARQQYFVAGGSALSPPGLDPAEPLRVEGTGMIGARRITEGFTDVGVRPAFDAPASLRARFEFLRLVREQAFLAL